MVVLDRMLTKLHAPGHKVRLEGEHLQGLNLLRSAFCVAKRVSCLTAALDACHWVWIYGTPAAACDTMAPVLSPTVTPRQ